MLGYLKNTTLSKYLVINVDIEQPRSACRPETALVLGI